MPKGQVIKSTLIAVSICFALVTGALAQTPKPVRVPPGPLAQALQSLSKQMGLQLIYEPKQVKAFHTAGVSGVHSARAAVRILLKGTPLVIKVDRTGAMAIVPAGSAGPADRQRVNAKGTKNDRTSAVSTGGEKDGHSGRDSSNTSKTLSYSQPEGDDIQPVLQEVLVTAEKKTQNIQDVPVSMSAVSSNTLISQNATRLTDVAAIVPGTEIASETGNPGSTNVTIRGITTASISSTTVATTIDDVPVGSSSSYAYAALFGTDIPPYVIKQIEILRGPQGTLYGADSLGGLVKYVTPTPSVRTFSLQVGGNLSRTNHPGSQIGNTANAAVNIPLIPGKLAINAAAGRAYTPGYINDVATNKRAYNDGAQDAARLTILWDITDKLSLNLMGLYNHSAFNGFGTVPFDVSTAQPILGYTETNTLLQSGDNRTLNLGVATIKYKFNWGTLGSISGYSYDRALANYDLGSLAQILGYAGFLAPGFNELNMKKFSEELRLASSRARRLQWMIGAFYTHENTKYIEIDSALNQNAATPSSFALYNTYNPSTFAERAVFGSLTYRITKKWTAGAGLRYSSNHQTFSSYASGVLASGSAFPQPSSDHSTTFSVTSRYHFKQNLMLYTRIASGFRPGGSNVNLGPGVPRTFGPDHLVSYELGIKSELLNRRLLLNFTGFYINWSDIQLTDRTPTDTTFIGNSGLAVSKGMEFKTGYRIINGVRVGLNGSYVDARLKTNAPAVGAESGDRLPYAPAFSGAMTVDLNHRFDHRYEGNIHAAWRYVSAVQSNFPHSESGDAHLPAYNVVDLTGGISWGRWNVNVFVRNANNEHAFLSSEVFGAAVLPPLSIGTGFEYRY